MTDAKTFQNQADASLREARSLQQAGKLLQAVTAQRQSVLFYTAAENALRQLESNSARADLDLRRAHAAACREFGDLLTEVESYPEAAKIYQEATDLYSQIGDAESETEARACARKVLASVAALRAHPQERLYLLIAHYERQQRQLEIEAGTEAQQADCCVRMARVFQRRERPQEAVPRYLEALRLYSQAEPTEEILLACAECHHRIATLQSLYLNDLPAAAQHYRTAIALYSEHEPIVYGEQSARALCEQALSEIEPFLQ